MIGVDAVYALAGFLFAGVAILSARDRTNPKRWRNALFWGLVALSFLAGSRIGDLANGCLVLTLALIAGFGGLGRSAPDAAAAAGEAETRAAAARRFGDRLFIPALAVPVTTLFGALVLAKVEIAGHPLIDPKQTTPIALGLGVVVALGIAFALFRPRPAEPLQAARRLMDQVGWAALLPQTLAALGIVFALSGVGRAVGEIATRWLPLETPLAAVCVFTLGMALFTVVMGNAFAAFPVMTAAIGAPLIVRKFGGDPAVMGAIGMLSGFCGTLVTPMAANFNIVPAALLGLKDRNAVIKVQAPTAGLLLIANTALLYLLVFRK
jgi:uncharacterized membrane protein